MDGFDEVVLDDSRHIQPRSNQPNSRSKRKKHKNNGLPQVSDIQVKDPDKRGEGVQTYIVYRIFTTFTDGETKKGKRICLLCKRAKYYNARAIMLFLNTKASCVSRSKI